jgi:hypothetical protein
VEAFHASAVPKFRQLLGVDLLGMTPLDPQYDDHKHARFVTLLTRRSGPIWSNREYVASGLRKAIYRANTRLGYNLYVFRDAGFAEDLGLKDNCYRIRPQIDLWASSWLVLAPHGAHETNVLFMPGSSGGLVEGFACGHQSGTFSDLANYSQVAYRAAREIDNGDRHNCLKNNHRKYLDKPRSIQFEHDTMLAMVEEAMSKSPLYL